MHRAPISLPALRGAHVAWREWNRAAFEAARTERKLVLLFVTVPWCSTCAALESIEFARADVAELLRERFIPVRVNACARPDIGDRYLAAGWPTVACLTADGDPLTAATPTDADEIVALLRRTSDAFTTRHAELSARASERRHEEPASSASPPPAGLVDASAADAIVDLAAGAFDSTHAGFGEGPKIPHAPLLRLLLGRADHDERCRTMVMSTLDAVGASLRDPADGGFFRAAHRRDWSEPDTAKLVEINAELIELFADAGEALTESRYLDIVSSSVRFVDDRLADEAGGFSIDGTLYADANGVMARAYFRAGAALNESRLIEFAVRTLERIMVAVYQPGAGVSHDAGGHSTVRGLLTDHVQCAFALAESAAAAGIVPHLMLAEELIRYADRTMWDHREGGLLDRVGAVAGAPNDDVGLLREPLKPFALNCDAARVWLRLAALAETPDYRARAIATLASQTPFVRERGLFGAPYAIALEELQRSP